MILPRYSFGVGDRFGCEGEAQLQAVLQAHEEGVQVAPVWNKSQREHGIIGSSPGDVRKEADAAVAALGYEGPYFVDADHIGLNDVDEFVEPSNFFTLDVAEQIGAAPSDEKLQTFIEAHPELTGTIEVTGLSESVDLSVNRLQEIAQTYLTAVGRAGRIYRAIAEQKNDDQYVIEMSMDETDRPQQPEELLVILAAAADEGIPLQTVAPKLHGEFHKGVDYVGNTDHFARFFEAYLAIVDHAVERYGLPDNLKLSIHSGSDKFSIYPHIRRLIQKFDTGLHIKTAGTTWLEEVTGLAEADADGLDLARFIYREARSRQDELCAPYNTVLSIDESHLPAVEEVNNWDSETFVQTLEHNPDCPDYNPSFRQLIHVSYAIAAELDERFFEALDRHSAVVSRRVKDNLYDNHIAPLFV